jgi:ATP-binding cassette, subfamily B, multidrug efflux pump
VLYAFTNYVQQFFQPISDLSEKYNLVQQAMASSERVFELLDSDDYLPGNAQALVPDSGLGKVEFRNVWFAYVGEEWVLRDVSFVIEPGQTVAFVGATGAGKSSILSLMSRFYDIQKGQILVDDLDVREWPLAALRRRVGVVLQDVFLFSGTVEDNIRLGQPDIGPERIREVVQYVNAEPFINKLPGGLQHRVQERGSTFSAGERQLIAFARALAFDPNVLVLDEATANIDTETEQWIQEALIRLTKERTTIVVAHRLSTIQHADNIIVMHKGRVRESGTHQALLHTQGLYWNLYQLQYREQEPAATS